LGSTRTAPSTSKASPSDDGIVELKPPPEFGFSGTAKFLAVEQAALIADLLARGYTRVDRARD
jgi:hypothetical protein